MSIFSKIKGASQAAKEHKKAQTPDPGLQKSTPARTRHVPTHAAIDAMLGAPSSWKEIDRSAIRAQHKRRSMMPRNDSGSSTPLRRNHSQGFYDTSTNYGSEYGIALSRLEPKRSHSSYFPYQPSRLANHGVSPTISEVNSSSSSSAEIRETPYAATKYAQTRILHDTPHASKHELGEPSSSARQPAL